MKHRKKLFYSKANHALGEVAQRGCGVLMPEDVET